MGAHSRTKGHAFERLVANMLRSAFPTATVRRGQQAAGAHEPDVVIENNVLGDMVGALWLECNHADAPNPRVKLDQALRDMKAAGLERWQRFPVVVWRRTGSRDVLATMELMDTPWFGGSLDFAPHGAVPVTLRFTDLLTMLGGKDSDNGNGTP